jgi:hypothetical protein
MMSRLAAALALAFVTIACNADASDEPDAGAFCAGEYRAYIPRSPPPRLDLLIVVDRSLSMADEADHLAEQLALMTVVLESFEDGPPSLHVAMVSSDVGAEGVPGCSARGDDGRFQVGAEGCFNDERRYLRHELLGDGTAVTNYAGTFAEAVACLGPPPADGCAVEQPLEAVRRALDGSNPGNDGFLREGAWRYVLFITDEDDCSLANPAAFAATVPTGATPAEIEAWSSLRCFDGDGVAALDEYVDLLWNVRDGRTLLGVVSGGTNPAVYTPDGITPSCTSERGTSASPAPRLGALRARFADYSTFAWLCDDDWTDALGVLVDGFGMTLGYPCIAADLDVDRLTPGIQHDCTVIERPASAPPGSGTVIPECPSGSPDEGDAACWHLEADPSSFCGEGDNFTLELERGPVEPPLVNTRLDLHCATLCGED